VTPVMSDTTYLEEPPPRWFNTPQGWAVLGIAMMVVALLIACMWRADLSLRPADATQVDQAVKRVGGQALHGPSQFGGKTFHPFRQLSVVGRCLDCAAYPPVPGGLSVVLLLGADAANDDALRTPVTFTGDKAVVTPGAVTHYAIFHLLPSDSVALVAPTKGDFVSLVGDLGDLDDHLTGNEEYTVRLTKFQQQP